MRLHLFEFNDQPWLPTRIRNALTLYLNAAYRTTPFGGLFATRIATLLNVSGSNKIVDLCSGSGGPIQLVEAELHRAGVNPRITLTDLFPNKELKLDAHGSLAYWPDPVDARDVPAQLTGLRTMFASFHHFKPQDAAKILRDAFEKRCPIGVFEVTARTPIGIAGATVIPFLALVMTLTIRPLTFLQVVLTYVLPILPVIIFWDGLVSQLRTYTPVELSAMTKDLCSPDYVWEFGMIRVTGTPLSVPYLTGRPSAAR